MKKILMIAYHFPPEEGSCSDKNLKMLEALQDEGLKVDILTVGLNQESEKYKESSIIRINPGLLHKNRISSIHCRPNNAALNKNSLKNKLKRFVQRNIIPDPTIDWYFPVIDWAKKNKNLLQEYSLILSISSPYSVHIITKKLSDMFQIPFICTYGDPWIYEPSRRRGKIRYWIEKRLENSIIQKAKKVFVITDYNKREYEKLYKTEPNKINTFNIGLRLNNISTINRNSNKEILRLIYGGSLNPIHRDIRPYMRALEDVNGFLTIIYNNDYPQIYSHLPQQNPEQVIIRPLIPTKEFQNELGKSDVLILFGNKTPYQVPGKLFEMISTGIHILYIKNNDSLIDGSEIILKKYGNATIVKNDYKSIQKALIEIRQNSDRILSVNVQNILEFEFHNTMKPIVSSIKNILSI